MGETITTSVDGFAAAFNKILEEMDSSMNKGATKAVDRTLKYGVEREKAYAAGAVGVVTGRYHSGIARKWINNSERKMSGEIGNKNSPGLAHLLEKGHATIGGNRVRAYPHIADAAEDTFKYLEEQIKLMIEEAVS